jgi:hypothetical protein
LMSTLESFDWGTSTWRFKTMSSSFAPARTADIDSETFDATDAVPS